MGTRTSTAPANGNGSAGRARAGATGPSGGSGRPWTVEGSGLVTAHFALTVILAGLRVAVVLEDCAGQVVVANQPLADLVGTGIAVDDLTGLDGARLVDLIAARAADPTGYVATVDRRRAGRRPVLDEEIGLADGRTLERDYLPVAPAGGPGSVPGSGDCLWVFRDVSHRRRAEQRLAAEHRRLTAAGRAHDRFVATVSHELRTPLTSIVTAAELLTVVGGLDGEQAKLVDIVDRNAERLLHLVEDLREPH